jgi:phosphatidylinositol 3-kinase
VLATSREDGFLEFVPNSKTLQEILKEKKNLTNYFKSLAKEISGVKMSDSKNLISPSNSKIDLNKTISDDEEMNSPSKGELLKPEISKSLSTERIEEKILDNYINSCAGYCVMTYFLGIGDRHLENVLLDNQGNFYILFKFQNKKINKNNITKI